MAINQILTYFSEEKAVASINTRLLFNKVVGFQGVVSGVGVSTIVANLAYTLSKKTDLSVCILDTSFMTPIHYKQIVSVENDTKDILDFVDDLSYVCYKSKIPRVYLTGLIDRSLIDMLSQRDSGEVINKLISTLKDSFDVILVDLTNEYTNIRVEAAIKCNKIYTVMDTSARSMLNIAKFINTNSTTVIPFYKCRDAIVLKTIEGVTDKLVKSLETYDFEVISEIPFDLEVYKNSIDGVMLYDRVSSGDSVSKFNQLLLDLAYTLLPESAIKKLSEDKSLSTQDGGKRVKAESTVVRGVVPPQKDATKSKLFKKEDVQEQVKPKSTPEKDEKLKKRKLFGKSNVKKDTTDDVTSIKVAGGDE